MIDYKFSLELTKNGVQASLHSKSDEDSSRRMIITLTVKGEVYDLNGKSVRVFFDDNSYLDTATIENNRIVFVIPKAMLSVSGKRICEFKISENDSVLYSPRVEVVVEGSLEYEGAQEMIGSSAKLVTQSAFDDAISGVNERIDVIDGVISESAPEIEKISTIESDVNTIKEDLPDLKDKAHEHSNKDDILDNLGEDEEGNLTFNGATIKPSADSTQPDWRESNEKSPNYVRNKTHYAYGTRYVNPKVYDTHVVINGEAYPACKVADSIDDISMMYKVAWNDVVPNMDYYQNDEFINPWEEDTGVVGLDGIVYVSETFTKAAYKDGTLQNVTTEKGLYFLGALWVEKDEIFLTKEIKKLDNRFVDGRPIRSKTYEDLQVSAIFEGVGTGVASIIIVDQKDFFSNKIVLDVEWEDSSWGKISLSILMDAWMVDSYCVPQFFSTPLYSETLKGHIILNFYSPDVMGYAGEIRNGSSVTSLTIKYIEV